jgi:hypothetical protein
MTTPMTTSRSTRRRGNRRGSALVLVLIMTLSLAGLAISAIYLSSSAGLLTRYYDKERDYRYAAEAALALGKSQVNKNASLGLPEDTAKQMLSGATLTDAYGANISTIRVNLYGAYTGDTVGRFGQFVTLLSQAYDSGGTRHVRRLDLTAESFSRFAMFTNTFSTGLAYGNGEFVRGRAHSNQGWYSSGSPGPQYGDTVSAVGSVTGSATYFYSPGYLASQPTIAFPTVSKLAALKNYALNANLQFTPQTASSAAATFQAGMDLSGRDPPASGGNAKRSTRVRFKPVDVNNDGVIQEEEGMAEVFDAAAGIDTASMRVDLPTGATSLYTNVVAMNQCGLLVKIGTRNQFFPVTRFQEAWVRALVLTGKRVVGGANYVAADLTGLNDWSTAAKQKANIARVLGFGTGNSRCFPPGSPYLMLTERYVTNSAGTCTINTTAGVTTYAFGAVFACPVAKQYGGQDSTFTAVVTRCAINVTSAGVPTTGGLCAGGQVALGNWVVFAGTQVPTTASTPNFDVSEKPYLWPLYKPYNLNSKGVINATTGPVYLSDTLRGNITFYQSDSTKDVVLIDDLVYDQSPNSTTALCRNFLGIISARHVIQSNNALNRPRDDGNGVIRWFGFPDFTLHAVTMSLTGTVGIEDGFSGGTPGGPNTVTNAGAGTLPTYCGAGNNTSGGCINQTGGVIEQYISVTFSGSNGLRENRTVDPCQLTNRRPPFFPQTGRYLDNKYYEIDPINVDSWTQVKAFYARLRGRSAP